MKRIEDEDDGRAPKTGKRRSRQTGRRAGSLLHMLSRASYDE